MYFACEMHLNCEWMREKAVVGWIMATKHLIQIPEMCDCCIIQQKRPCRFLTDMVNLGPSHVLYFFGPSKILS